MTDRSTTNILMYHSIAHGHGPLAIDLDTFRGQLDAIAARGLRAISLRQLITQWDNGHGDRQSIVLTFDDGYRDFAESVVPEMRSRGWSCTLFLPTDLVGSEWNPDGTGARSIITWDQARQALASGIEIGAHAMSHRDLTRLSEKDAVDEIETSKSILEQHLNAPVVSFAAPFGRITSSLRAHVARVYQCAVGTRMASAGPEHDRFDLPRIDMWYFRNARRWQAYLDGARTYFEWRRLLRQARQKRIESFW